MKKKLLYITGIMVLFMALVGIWGYNKYFKPDMEVQQQLNNQFGANFFNAFDDKKEINNSGAVVNIVKSVADLKEKIEIPTPLSMLEKAKAQQESNLVTTSTTSTTTTTTTAPVPVNETIVANKITQDEINSKYQPQFNYIQNVALSRLDILYSAAIQEYVQQKKAGALNRSGLIQKYIQAGNMLEASVDSRFYSTLNAMQADLTANNLPTDLVGVNKSEYEKAKSDKRSQLLAKALK
ncbi:MAG: hypothetical protein P4L59_06575 [Desulfosporosinus sp.]|nr:hypothetical protein [Desulfosporosinus sp.]